MAAMLLDEPSVSFTEERKIRSLGLLWVGCLGGFFFIFIFFLDM